VVDDVDVAPPAPPVWLVDPVVELAAPLPVVVLPPVSLLPPAPTPSELVPVPLALEPPEDDQPGES
jgi:hypothetical protein